MCTSIVEIVGATGAVGTVMLAKLKERGFPASEIVPFASERSAGRELEGFGTVRALDQETIQNFDIAIFSAGGATSGEWAPRFVEAGAVVVDNSSKWRRDPEVPLVVAEVNPDALEDHKGLIANPNRSTMHRSSNPDSMDCSAAGCPDDGLPPPLPSS